MKERAGLPASGRATMLGLNLVKPLKFPSWLRILPTTTATTNKKRPHVATTSSPSTTPHELPQLNISETLDTCLQSNGAMQPFHTLFEQSFLEFEPKNEGITSSIEQLQTPCPSDTVTSKFEDCDFKPTIQIPDSTDCILENVNQSADSLTALANEQASSFTILPSLLGNEVESIPFRAMFPDYLISDQVESIVDTNDDAAPVLELPSLCPLVIRPLSFDSQGAFDGFLGSNFTTTIKAHNFKLLNEETPSNYNNGRTSPESSTISTDSFSSLSESPYSSRRSSWATSISTRLGDDDIDQSTLGYEKPTAESDQSDDIELINDYQHYNQLIELGDPKNTRDRDFIPQQPIERHNEVALPEKWTHAASDLADDASGIKDSDDLKTPITQTGSDAQQDSMQAEDMQLESMQPDMEPNLESESINISPSTPAEAEAWAHSYCEENSDSVKLKVLRDVNDREYVLYRDCFHCIPIELAPEFADDFQEEEDDDDDGYGSATEACDAGGDGVNLGTIPEEENEG